MRNQLDATGIDVEFFTAVEGDSTHEDIFGSFDPRAFLINAGWTARPGEIGCFASHRLLWRKCVSLGKPILIMEDDITLGVNFAGAFRAAESLIDRYGYIRLEGECARKKRKKLIRSVANFELYRYQSAPLGAMGYAISPNAAERLIAGSETLSAPVDIYIKKYWKHKQPLYCLLPYSVTSSDLKPQPTIAARPLGEKSISLRATQLLSQTIDIINRTRFNYAFPSTSEYLDG